VYPFYLGIDLHLKNTYVVLLDQEGNSIDERRIRSADLVEYVEKRVPRQTYAVLEATRNWPYFYDELDRRLARVELAHPKELKAISTAAVKTDRIDAKVLAQLARMNYLPIAYAAPQAVRDLRQYTRHREELVQLRTKAINRVHAILAQNQLTFPKSDLFGKQGREALNGYLHQVRPAAREVIQNHLALVDHLDELVNKTVQELQDALTADQKRIQRLLKTIPGIGPIHAATILAEVGDIQRFGRAKSLCNWAGLTPRIRNSDNVVRHGRISCAIHKHHQFSSVQLSRLQGLLPKGCYGRSEIGVSEPGQLSTLCDLDEGNRLAIMWLSVQLVWGLQWCFLCGFDAVGRVSQSSDPATPSVRRHSSSRQDFHGVVLRLQTTSSGQ
jgi:transposase